MTIRELREAIANLPDDGEVYVERIEDRYFEGVNPWSVKLIEGEEYRKMEELKRRGLAYVDLYSCFEQYIDTHCCINYDGKNLYITSHY